MNELAGLMHFGGLQNQLKDTVNPPEPVQSQTRGLEVPLKRYTTSRSKADSELSKQKSGFKRLISIPLDALVAKINLLRSAESKQTAAKKKTTWNELSDSVGFNFEKDQDFPCTEYTEAVFSQVNVEDLLSSQSLNESGDQLELNKDRLSKTIEDLDKKLHRNVELLPPTAESVVKFYIHEVPRLDENNEPEQSKEIVGEGIDLIVFGGGASDALSNIGFAAQISEILAKNKELKGKVRRVIIMPHLAGTTKTGYPVNPAMTNDLGPAADIMIKALEQAGVRLSNDICLTGFSAGGNQAVMMADRLLDKGFNPRLVLLEPAIGNNPNIDLRVAEKGFVDPYNYARNVVEGKGKLSRAQSLRYSIRSIMRAWDTQDGPAGKRLPLELLRGYVKAPFSWMEQEAQASGIRDELGSFVPNSQVLSADSTAKVRTKIATKNVPVSLLYVSEATTVDPEGFRTKDVSERTPEYFGKRAAQTFPGSNLVDVTTIKGGVHYDAMWNIDGLTKALAAALKHPTQPSPIPVIEN